MTRTVSILILLDVILEDFIPNNPRGETLLFQSLFCWMLFWKILLPEWIGSVCWVSILILLDVILEVPWLIVLRTSNIVSILILLDVILEARGRNARANSGIVSILILLDVILEDPQPVEKEMNPFKFQSLFCWMLFWKKNTMIHKDDFYMFQSLFCWMLFWKTIANSVQRNRIMFQSLFCWMLFWKWRSGRTWCCRPL